MKSRNGKHRRNRNAEYEQRRLIAEQEAAMNTLNLQLDSLSQDGIARVVKRAFASIEAQAKADNGGKEQA